MPNKKIVYEQVGKLVYGTDTDGQLLQEFTDELYNVGESKKLKMKNRGEMAAAIAIKIFEYLESYHIPTIFISQYSNREFLIKNCKTLPLEVVVHNYADKSFGKKNGLKPGEKLKMPATELYSIDEKAEKKAVEEPELVSTGILSAEDMRMVKRIILKVNALLIAYFNRRNLHLVNYRMNFGKQKGQMVINSEIIPEYCTFSDPQKDGFENLSIQETYQEVFMRLAG